MLNYKNIQKAGSLTSRFQSETDGNITALFATFFSTLALSVAVIIDVGSTLSAKAKMQKALDEAVLAAAHSASDDFSKSGQTAYEINLSEDRVESSVVTFEKQADDHTGKIVGTATGSVPLLFSGILKQPTPDISVHSAATVPAATTELVPLNQ